MRIVFNGQAVASGAADLAALLREQGIDGAGVATALDGRFVPREQRAHTRLDEGARVEVLAPMQGG